jgi:serine/threonine-protein kinase HipA
MKVHVAIDTAEGVRQVGSLYHEARGAREFSVFEYLQEWRESGGFALAPTMPPGDQVYTSKPAGTLHGSALPGPIADAAPDAWGERLIRAQWRALSRPVPNDLDFLLEVSDECRWGALRFADATGQSLAHLNSPIKLMELEQLVDDVARFEKTGNLPEGLARNIAAASSPGGARPKVIVRDRDSLYIAKFTSVADENKAVERAEVLALRLAQRAGIHVPSARVVGAREAPIALIERFDRTGAQRHHVISGQSFLGVPTADGNDYADLIEQMRAHAAEFPRQSRELYARVAFNVLIRSTDDHLKNVAFVHTENGRWNLTSAFDLNPQPERHPQLKTAINGRFDATVDNLLSGSTAFGIDFKEAKDIIHRVGRVVECHWRAEAAQAGMSKVEIDRYACAFVHEEVSKSLKLDVPQAQPSKSAPARKRRQARQRDTGRAE